MIEIIGEEGSPEFGAARLFERELTNALGEWVCARSDIKVVVSAKTYGEQRQDIDLLILADLTKAVPLEQSGNDSTLLKSFVLTVEVKRHSPKSLEFRGSKVFVRYKSGLEDASEQAEQQKYSVIKFIERTGARAPYVNAAILLLNCPRELVPDACSNVLGGDFDGQDFLALMLRLNKQRLKGRGRLVQAFDQQFGSHYVEAARLFTSKLIPTELDRKKIEVITSRNFQQRYATEVGKQLLIFSGAGGTGKTVNLLQLAYFLYREKDSKSLILTYNHALVSDIKRLIALMGIGDDIASARVSIQTVHSFIYEVLCATGLFQRGAEGFLARYEALKDELLGLSQALARDDVEHWDHVFVDEGQDWPVNERDIIYRLYGPSSVVVADGRSQLIRSRAHCDWTQGKKIKAQIVTLRKALRLKHDICTFFDRVVDLLELPDWRTEPNLSVYGGRVLIHVGDLRADESFIRNLVDDAVSQGNSHVDLLFCVPPSHAGPSAEMVGALRGWGFDVWNGLDLEERQSYPTRKEQLRLVQYDSCRGLEGWTVFNVALDKLYDHKMRLFSEDDGPAAKDFFLEDKDAQLQFVRRWIAIPLTRAIDTLVINLEDPNHPLAQTLKEASHGNPSVEWVGGSSA